jgi:hypothetical protein
MLKRMWMWKKWSDKGMYITHRCENVVLLVKKGLFSSIQGNYSTQCGKLIKTGNMKKKNVPLICTPRARFSLNQLLRAKNVREYLCGVRTRLTFRGIIYRRLTL